MKAKTCKEGMCIQADSTRPFLLPQSSVQRGRGTGKMRYLVNSAQMKRADAYTIQELGICSMELMERAAKACVQVMEEEALDLSAPCVVCGSGNNGGDGFAIARMLLLKGYPAAVCFVGNESRCTDETKQQMKKLSEIGGKIRHEYTEGEYSIIIDAVFGVGLGREIRGDYLEVIERMNTADAVKFAVDMPSGISADTGEVLGAAFCADLTVTFQLEKVGLVLYPGKKYAGNVKTVDIGICTKQPGQEYSAAYVLDRKDLSRLLPAREADSMCIGSGLGRGEISERIVKKVLSDVKVPCLVDADGLNILAEHEEYQALFNKDRTDANIMVLTPHMKEMSRLLNESVDRIKAQRMKLLKEYAGRMSCTCVLKDSRTVTVSPDQGSYVNRSGNAAMAKAGSGDVLAGVISGLMAQGLSGHSAGVLGTYLHGRAGDHARRRLGSYSVLAGDLLSCLSEALKELEEEQREEL